MLEIKTIEWKNFMSYGDYISSIDLENVGQCLITGQIFEDGDKSSYDDSDTAELKKSNGSGKSAFVNVIQWAVFGRTMHSSNPGDAVINYFTGKDCYAKITFKNGDYIIRTRKSSGGNELIYSKSGDETKLTSDTLSTTKNMQAHLNKAFKLDWDLFCGSVFFNQYSKPWLEMAENSRKKALERMLRVDRFAYYARVAKGKIDSVESTNNSHLSKYNSIKDAIKLHEEQKERVLKSAENFTENQKLRKAELEQQIKTIEAKLETATEPNLEKLEKKWNIINQINDKISQMESQCTKINNTTQSKKYDLNRFNQTIEEWTAKAGKLCISCKQSIPSAHTNNIISPIEEQANSIKEEIATLKKNYDKIASTIQQLEEQVEAKTPDMSLEKAQNIIETNNNRRKQIEVIQRQILALDGEKNPHFEMIEVIDTKIIELKQGITSYEGKVEKNNYLIKHLNYIYKAYNDRNKIKSEVFREHIPFINGRLKHYLEVFGLDINIELTENLGIKSDKWGYDFESGGERKRTDVAFMLATFDFHEYMYGRQCNLLVLDEVDGRLDDDGINSLINIIKNDIASKVETVLIISHRPDMHDIFPSQINIIRENRFSRIESVSR